MAQLAERPAHPLGVVVRHTSQATLQRRDAPGVREGEGGLAPRGQDVQVGVGHLEAGDDEGRAGGVEGTLLGEPDVLGDDDKVGEDV